MVKVLHCRDLGFPEDTVICADSEQELMKKTAEHARTVHGKTEFSSDEMQQIRSKIRNEDHCPEMR